MPEEEDAQRANVNAVIYEHSDGALALQKKTFREPNPYMKAIWFL